MTVPLTDHSKGLLLTAIGGLALTADIPLIKLAGGDVWSILLLRGISTLAAALLLWVVWRAVARNAPPLIPGRAGLAVAGLYGITSLCFISAVFYTSTANLVFIVAFSTVFAMAFSWLFLGERPRPQTLAAMAMMIVAIAIIVQDGLTSNGWFGDLLALGAAVCVAAAIVVSRASGRDMGFTPLVAVILPMAIGGAMVYANGLNVDAPWWIILDGFVVIPIAFFLLATGPRYISGPEVAMFYLLETVLAPIWVWLIFAEVPSTQSLIGGALLVATLLAHSLWQISQGRRRRAAAVVRHAP
ncbi:DMT family transporter [Mesorhizobium sp. CAU 1741]|uniref:DMT family transporter n=1 Tax=Mesorhizobium sp. CAU 1741 TaxID=3140366 RepID=UPI00325AE65D